MTCLCASFESCTTWSTPILSTLSIFSSLVCRPSCCYITGVLEYIKENTQLHVKQVTQSLGHLNTEKTYVKEHIYKITSVPVERHRCHHRIDVIHPVLCHQLILVVLLPNPVTRNAKVYTVEQGHMYFHHPDDSKNYFPTTTITIPCIFHISHYTCTLMAWWGCPMIYVIGEWASEGMQLGGHNSGMSVIDRWSTIHLTT